MTLTKIIEKKGQQVDSEHADQLISTYKKERWIHNTKLLGKPDSLSIWYGMDELAGFMEIARNHGADGVKMYFGVYPENFEENSILNGRQTIVLVATKRNNTGQGIFNKNIYMQVNGKSEILAFNFGQMCPPYCGEGWPPPTGIIEMEMEKIGLTILEQDKKTIII